MTVTYCVCAVHVFCKLRKPVDQGPVVRRVDNIIQRINSYPADKIGAFLILIGQRVNFIHWIGIYPLDKVIHSLYNRALLVIVVRHKMCIKKDVHVY